MEFGHGATNMDFDHGAKEPESEPDSKKRIKITRGLHNLVSQRRIEEIIHEEELLKAGISFLRISAMSKLECYEFIIETDKKGKTSDLYKIFGLSEESVHDEELVKIHVNTVHRRYKLLVEAEKQAVEEYKFQYEDYLERAKRNTEIRMALMQSQIHANTLDACRFRFKPNVASESRRGEGGRKKKKGKKGEGSEGGRKKKEGKKGEGSDGWKEGKKGEGSDGFAAESVSCKQT
jgi:hypothetical protein